MGGTRMRLWYQQPAAAWVEALPLGNGRLGAMVFGDPLHERFALNEDSLWSGIPTDHNLKDVYPHFLKAQELMLSGDAAAAQRETEKHILGPFTEAYEPYGDLYLDITGASDTCTGYTRELDLDHAVCTTQYLLGNEQVRVESFISAPDQVMVIRLAASGRGVTARARLDSPLKHNCRAEENDTLLMSVQCPTGSVPSYVPGVPDPVTYAEDQEKRGLSAVGILKAVCDGTCAACENTLILSGFSEAVLVFACRSDYADFNILPARTGIDPEALSRADIEKAGLSFEPLLKAHEQDHAALYQRQSIQVEGNEREMLPTDERLRLFREDGNDPSLPVLLYQFGRYLMISASRPGTRAMNLQGIWNDMVRPPWSCNYTTNINVEMNYWPAEICNLSELHEPFFTQLQHMMETGARTAKNIFNARGSCANHNSDLWAHTTPVGEHGIGNGLWGWWPMGFGWMCEHLWEHFIYTDDTVFLKETALPLLRAAAQFFIDTCAEGPDGYKAFRLATSPENRYLLNGEEIAFAGHTTMSDSIVREVLSNYLSALEALGITEDDENDARDLLLRLPPPRVLPDGRLAEWDGEKQEVEPQHRHISHLYGLFPAHEFKDEDTALRDACKASLAVRGDDGTGWSLGWKINVWARLRDGDHALKLIHRQLRLVEPGKEQFEGGGTFPNLFDAHPPFQIDGNFAAASGLARLLIDSDRDDIRILPALPSAWKNLQATGLRGANGFTFDLKVENGKLTSLVAHSVSARRTRIHVNGIIGELTIQPGDSMEMAYIF